MTMYVFYQLEEKSKWELGLASERDNIIREKKPALMTVLAVDQTFENDAALEQKESAKFYGPAYFDFDSEDLDEVIPEFQQLLTNLKAKGCNLNALRIYCSGGKGFHIEMPAAMLMAKVPVAGIQALPLIYREIAHELYVNTLDLRVYSLGKGRQWRCPNVKRSNGKYKVQITVEEALAITAERYAELVAHPRPLFPVEEPAFTPDLALIFSKSRDKVENGIRNRKKRKKQPDELARFKGEWPETMRLILQGEGLKDNIGWNFLCVQLALTAVSLGKTEEQLKEDAKGLLETYAGDSSRYNTPRKRWAELRKQYQYMAENPCYEFSIGGVLSMVKPALKEKTDLTQGEYVPDGTEEEEESEDGDDETRETTKKVRVNSYGMYSMTENGWKNISHVGMADPVLLVNPADGKQIGYDVEILVDGKKKGRHLLNLQSLSTKANLHSYAISFNASFRGTDMDASNIVDLMRHRVESKAKISLVTQVEGISLVLPPGSKSEEDLEIIWSSPYEVISTSGKNHYTFKPLNTQSGTYKSDLYSAPALSNCDEDREMIQDMLRVNAPHNLAKILGWFGATFFCPILRRRYNQFPLLQVYGGATAGKSKTIALLSHMHYHLQKPKIMQASGMTKYPLLAAVSSSSSLPVVIEELRPRLMRAGGMYEMVINTMKSNYDGHDMARGGLGDKGSAPVVNDYANTAPIVFTAEEQNGEVAIQERSVQVCMTKGDRQGREEAYKRLLGRATNLGRLGKSMLVNALALDMNKFIADFNEAHEVVINGMGDKAAGRDRPIYNLATTIMGLRFMQMTVAEVFGTEFDEDFELMHGYITDHLEDFVPQNMSESARVLDTLAQLSKTKDLQYMLEVNRDYTVSVCKSFVDIKLKPAYAKYMRYTRSLGMSPLFESDAAFIAAMNRYEGVVQRACPDSILFDNPFETIFRFSAEHLAKDNIEPFK